ncbi:MAG TPA: helix-turn-helix domain-containing protein [Thermoleophilaceae bacterium]|jgi:AcrR family transcriptional regulator
MSTTEQTAVRQLRADARRNRERILEAAKEVFGEDGADAQMDDVARRAGVGVGTVYRHFPNKDVLMGELVTEKFTGFTEAAREALKEDDAWEGFSELLHGTAEHMAENVALQDALRTTGKAFEYAEPARLELNAVMDKLIKRAQRQGTMRKDFKADELGMLMSGLCASMSGPLPEQRNWQRHLEILLDGLRAKPGARPRRAS